MQEEPTPRRCPQPALKHGSTKRHTALKPSKIRDVPGRGKVQPSPPVWPLHLFGDDPLARGARPAPPTTPANRRRGGRTSPQSKFKTAARGRRQRVTLLTDRAQVGAALARASQWIKRRNASPREESARVRLTLAMTPYLAARGRRPQQHRSPPTPELQRSPRTAIAKKNPLKRSGDGGQPPPRRRERVAVRGSV